MVNNIEEHFQFNSGQLKMATEWGKETKGLDTCKVFFILSDVIWKAVSISNIFHLYFYLVFTLPAAATGFCRGRRKQGALQHLSPALS